MATRKLRKDDLLGRRLLDWELKRADLYDFTKVQQLPTYAYLFSRFYTILSEKGSSEKNRLNDATLQLSKEFRDIWITLNVYPLKLDNIKRKFDLLLKDFNSLVTRGGSQKQKAWWKKKAQAICDSLGNGVDIITKDDEYRKSLGKIYGVKMTAAENVFYEDNCVPINDEDSPNFGKCARQRWSTDEDKDWLASAKRRQKRIQAEHDREMRYKAGNASGDSADVVENTPASSNDQDNDEDIDYTPPKKKNKLFERTSQIFPEIPARYSYKEFNLDLIETIAEVECRFEVPANRSRELVAFVLNSLAGQHLEVPSEDAEEVEEKEISSADEEGKQVKEKEISSADEEGKQVKEKEISSADEEVKQVEEKEKEKGKRRKFECKSNVMCSRTTMRKYIADAGILNLMYAAEKIKKSNEDSSVITAG